MTQAFQPTLDFEACDAGAGQEEALILDLDGFEGPLHLLLELARRQKVDLLRISIAELADQYGAFVRSARGRRFTLAADYLVMAAWLAYLKSRLLLPKPERAGGEEPPAEEVAATLAFRLAKLDVMRKAAVALAGLPQAGRDVFLRGAPEARSADSEGALENDLFRLLEAYVGQRRGVRVRSYRPSPRVQAYPLEDARRRLWAMLPSLAAWTPLTRVTPEAGRVGGPSATSCVASTFCAGLELVKEGALEMRQLEAFAIPYLKARRPSSQAFDPAADRSEGRSEDRAVDLAADRAA